MNIPLEDQFNDVISKAARGLGKSPSQLASEAGVSTDDVRSALDGAFDAAVVRALAAPLGLAAEPLIALGERSLATDPVELGGLRQFNTPFDEMTVNAYLVWDGASNSAAVFDTGSDVEPMLVAAGELGVRIEQVFITHSHGDHVFDLDRLVEKTGATAWAPRHEEVEGAVLFAPGREFSIGSLRVETRLTWGHARGGVTYVVRGLSHPVAICGDALFASSMGGGLVSYADALRTNREQIFSLSDDTVLAPGHGPLSTIGEQRGSNPFFPNV